MATVLAAAIVLVIAVLGMFVFMFKKDGEFPKYDVGSNEQMRKMGIRCFKDEDAALHSRTACDGDYSDACKECGLYDKQKSRQ